jgi:type I restriction enzyme M protein
MARTAKKKEEKKVSMEEALWDAADEMRGSVEYPVYKQVVLGLVFLKFVSERFEKRRQELIDEGHESMIDMSYSYTMKNVFYLPEKARWSYIATVAAKQNDLKIQIDQAMEIIEQNNESLRGALPSNFYVTVDLPVEKLASLVDIINSLDLTKDDEEDVIGRVYEYFLFKFSSKEGKGEFYTPKPIVKIITEMIQPLKGRIFDPCCGSGGMFVQSMKLVQAHHGNKTDVSIYGQEYNAATLKLAKMNLAIRGISANFGDHNDDSLRRDLFKDLRADFVMANPPFNQDKWGADELANDPRWVYGVPRGNANYAWIQHFLYHLNDNGVAGFVLANGSLTSNTNGDGEIRKNLVDRMVVDCIVALPEKLFYSTGIPVCLWFCSKSKVRRTDDTRNQILFIDCRKMGRMYDRTHRTIDDPEIEKIASTYHNWLAGKGYEDELGFCKAVPIKEVGESGYVLTPGRYVGLAPEEEDSEPYEEKMKRLTSELGKLFKESQKLEEEIKKNLAALGFEIN